jgi:hypothetical protein
MPCFIEDVSRVSLIHQNYPFYSIFLISQKSNIVIYHQSAVCPGNCAGRGLCDYGLEQCVCFNSSDTSSMCLNSPKFGNVTISNHSQSIPVPSLGVPAQQPLSSSGEKMRFDFINAYFILCTCVIMLRMIWD